MRRLSLLITGIAMLVMLVVPAAALAEGYVHLSDFGSYGSNPGQFYFCARVAVDGGLVYATSTNANLVEVFTLDGAYVRSWGSFGSGAAQFANGPTGIAIDHERQLVYVADYGNSRVEVFTPAGAYLSSIGSAGSADGQFTGIYGIALDSSGNLYASDWGGGRVQVFDPSGAFVRKFGTPGTADGQLSSPNGLAVEADGSVWVCDAFNSRLQKFDAAGTFVSKLGVGILSGPRDVAIDEDGHLIVGDRDLHRVLVFNATTGAQYGEVGVAADYSDAYGVTTAGGRVYVATGFGNNVQIWAHDKTAPVLTHDYDFEWHSLPYGVSFSAVDDYTPVPWLRWSWDASTWTNNGYATVPAPTDHSFDGVHKLWLGAGDSVSNWAYKTPRVKVDTRPPVTRLFNEVPYWVNADVTLSFAASDVGSGVALTEYTTDGGASWTPVPESGDVTFTDQGTTVVDYRSQDNCVDSPNVETFKETSVFIDKTPPVCAALNNPAVRRGAKATFKFTVADNLSPDCWVVIVIKKKAKIVKVIEAGSRLSPFTPTPALQSKSVRIKLPLGKYTWFANASDYAGNSFNSTVKRLTVK